MSEKNDFLDKVSELFFENGAKAVTMDDVAKHFAISKRTLYEEYKNKETLLEAVLNWKLQEVITTINSLDVENNNAVEKILLGEKDFEKFSNTNQSVFIRQLIKYYPAIFEQHILNMNEQIAIILTKNIELGRLQGLYRENFNEGLYIKFFLQLMLSFESSPLFESEQCDRGYFCYQGVMFYLQSITTEKGRIVLEKMNLDGHLSNIKKN